MKVKSESEVTQSCLTLSDPMDYSLPGSSVHGIFQVRMLEWLPFSSPGDLPNPGIKLSSLVLKAQSLTIGLAGKSWSYAFMCMGDFWNDMPETVNGGYI